MLSLQSNLKLAVFILNQNKLFFTNLDEEFKKKKNKIFLSPVNPHDKYDQ